jgi:hypothetical protein
MEARKNERLFYNRRHRVGVAICQFAGAMEMTDQAANLG